MRRIHRALQACLGLVTFASPWPLVAAAQEQKRPNILFVTADNLGYGELGAYGGGVTRLPNPAFKGKTGYGDWADMLAEMDASVRRQILLWGIAEIGRRLSAGDEKE